MNVKLLKQARDYIAKHPEKYNQAHFCGTACCVAGTTAFLGKRITRRELAFGGKSGEVMISATKLLDIDEGEAARLFSATWGHVAGGRFSVSRYMDPVKRSQIAVKRINHFIKTKGAE